MFTAPLLAVLRSRRRRLAGQLDAAEHALAAAPANDRLPRWMRERVLAKRIRRGLARRDPDALQLFDDLRDTAPRTAMLRATAAALNLATGPVQCRRPPVPACP